MEASELRIGNQILVNGVPVVVGYGIITDLYQKNKGIKNNYLDTLTFAPIPLTEEWFLRAGFKKESLELPIEIFDVNNVFNWHEEDGGMVITFGYYGRIKIQYFHQLQNLYFALTGQELTIKL